MRIEFCDGCGAPLDARWNEIVLVCRYCGSQNAPGEKGEPVPSSVPDDGRLRLAVDGRAYLVLGKMAEGDSSIVYFGRWVRRLGELVVIKILRCSADRDLFAREHAMLRRLHESPSAGTPHFANLIPEPIAMGPVRLQGAERLVSIFRWHSGFVHSAEDVKAVYPDGVDPKIAVWVFKRLLELLSWTHQSRTVHGAILPPHIIIHPRDHGAMLIGWSTAMAMSSSGATTVLATSRAWKEWYPSTTSLGPADDLAMAARSVLWLAGATKLNPGGTLPSALLEVFADAQRHKYDDAWELRKAVTARAIETLGSPKYAPLLMPEWPDLTQN